MKTRSYVAPCVRKPKSDLATGVLIVGGLLFTTGGAGTIEKGSIILGLIVAVVGVMLMFYGARRAR